jgi:pyruvate formate lyase activating enzyme
VLDKKVIYDLSPFTHLDFPEHLACIVWFSGCNMRCDYCYNDDIVFAKSSKYSYKDILEFLKTRQNLLDGVVLSGGEATSHKLVEFCIEIKNMGFKIKLDTNGTNPLHVETLLESNLLDFVALDYKAPADKFIQITHSNKYKEFESTLRLLINSDIDFEVRTTLHDDLLDVDDINKIIKDLKQKGYKSTYYIQEFLDTGSNIGSINKPSKKLDKTKLSKELNIEFR